MMIPNLSAGTGPAAAILIGGVFYLMGHQLLGVIMLAAWGGTKYFLENEILGFPQ